MSKQEIKPCEFVSGACIHCEATEREKCEGWVCSPKRPWQGLTEQDMPSAENPMFDHQFFIAGLVYAAKVLQEKNNAAAQPEQRQPLTDEEIDALANNNGTVDLVSWWRQLARAIEAAHGIKEQP